jgi:hypothetical protein
MTAVTLSADLAALRPVVMKMTRRERIEFIVDMLVTALDLIDGDVDLEHDDPDSCEAREDRGSEPDLHGTHLPGDPEDAEDDDADEWSGVIVYDQEGRWRWA